MKKILVIVPVTLLMVCCGKAKSGKEIGEEVCACSKKANEMPATDPNRKKEQDKCMDRQMSAWDKVKDDREKALEFNEALSKCSKEQIENAFK